MEIKAYEVRKGERIFVTLKNGERRALITGSGLKTDRSGVSGTIRVRPALAPKGRRAYYDLYASDIDTIIRG